MPDAIEIDNCNTAVEIEDYNTDVEIEGCEKEVVTISCDDANAPPTTGRFELEFFNQSVLFVGQTAHRLPSIKDAYVLDLQRTKVLCNITIAHATRNVTADFLTPQSGFLIII